MTVQRFQNVQALRAVAALMVVIGHGANFQMFASGRYDVFVIAYSGVDIFFVISGFIISTTVFANPVNPAQFLLKRAARIFPLYWAVLALSVICSPWLLVGAPWIGKYPLYQPWEYLLLLRIYNGFVPQAWTLSYEIYFYAWVGVLVCFGTRWFWHALAVLMLGQAAMIAARLAGHESIDAMVVTSAHVIEFGLGCSVAYLCRRSVHRLTWVAGLVTLAGFIGGGIWTRHAGLLTSLPRLATFGIGSAALLYGLLAVEARGLLVLPRWMQRLGDLSYGIYLWHLLVFTLIAHWIDGAWFVQVWSRNLYGCACIGVVVAVSAASYRLIERPSLRAAHRGAERLTLPGGFGWAQARRS